ncbi:response regulator [Halorubrum sp. GN11_10-6_MGM]|uniref:response regulator n=1 Tax=Halorubrum sp. GN11_10-6_MGM TaxID=2518112 RepID=UPI0010F80420|nr:response regulator [Halorubrum sp. GN11_10-6_MGM]TKX73907.1 response regulator [Halorubrum sp. GN11_10-6_MGM]
MKQNASILHVDDEPSFTELVQTFLERQNEKFDVETANRVDEGLDRVSADNIDCIVSDYEMPGKNGIEFLRALRSKLPNLPFILYTGKGSEEIAGDAISAGATDYIQKQSGTDHYTLLANRIQNAVEQYHTEATAKRTDERYHNLVDTAPIPILLFDTDGRSVYANDSAVTFLNADSHADLENEAFTQFLHAEDQETASERFRTLMSEGGHAPEIEYRIRAIDGEIKKATVTTAYGYYQGEKVAQAMIHV